jgi:hypothetical protein
MKMIEYNGIIFIDGEEIWKFVNYEDIKRKTYEVSNFGRFRKAKTKKILTGNNPKNEKGYCRICLKNKEGKNRKYQMHRIVYTAFKGKIPKGAEINHINGNKLLNSINNLEILSRKENAKHAADHDLYQFGEDHYKSIFTNDEVEQICQYLEKGKPISEIINIMNLKDRGSIYSNIDKIIHKKVWVRISSKYNIDYKLYHYKTYTYDDICKMCDMIFNKKMKNKEIISKFPQYNSSNLNAALKSIRAFKIYKNISEKYTDQRLSKA